MHYGMSGPQIIYAAVLRMLSWMKEQHCTTGFSVGLGSCLEAGLE